MPRFAEADALVSIGCDAFGREARLAPGAAAAWRAMQATAAAEGVELRLVSAFRSIERQAEIVRKKLATGLSLAEILQVSAYPGFSEHHTGRAVDIASATDEPLSESFEQTSAFLWLQRHAREYGFRLTYPRGNTHGITYEPWHWCWCDAPPIPPDPRPN